MALFQYRVRDPSGAAFAGQLEAEAAGELIERLQGLGYSVVSVRGVKPGIGRWLGDLGGRLNLGRDRVHATRQLASLMRAGIPIVKALESASRNTRSRLLAEALTAVRDQVRAGDELWTSMARRRDLFPDVYTRLIQAGEASGSLEEVLFRLAAYGQRMLQLRGQLVSALAYPVVLVLLSGGVMAFLLLRVVPRFVTVFESVGADLPLLTRLLLGTAELAGRTFWLVPLVGIAAGLAGLRWLRTPLGRRRAETLLFSVPAVGALLRVGVTASLARTLATMLASGLPLLQALELTRQTTWSEVFGDSLDRAARSVTSGAGLADSLAVGSVFPSLFLDMLRTGEESGSLEEMLSNTADFYDNEVEDTLRTVTSLIEPALLVALGGVVLVVALSILLPMFNLIQLYHR